MAATATLAGKTVTVTPGGEAFSEVRIQNSGSVVDQFTLEIVGDASAWAVVQPAVVALFPGAGLVARIKFKPPKAPWVSAREISFAVRVRSREEPRASVVEEGMIIVGPFQDPSIELTPQTAIGSWVARAQLALNNRGNVAINAILTARNPDRSLTFSITPPGLTAEPGRTTFASICIRPQHHFLVGPPKLKPYKVQIHQINESTLTVDGSMQQEAVIPARLVPAVIVLTAFVLLALVLWLLKPVIGGVATAFLAKPSPVTQPLGWPGTIPPVTLSPSTVVINQAEGAAPAPAIVTLANNNDRPLLVTSIALDRGGSNDFSESNNCPTSMRAHSSCQITITLKRISVGDKRTRTGGLIVKDDASGSSLGTGASQYVPLLGSPAQSAVGFSVQSLTFAQNIGSSGRSEPIVLVNSGQVPVHLNRIRSEGDFSQNNNCATVMALGETCTINVTFIPGALGERSGYVVVVDDAFDSPQRIPLTGAATKPVARLAPARVNFGQILGGRTPPQTVTLTNRGDGPLTIAGIAATGDYKAIPHCPSVLLPGLSCTIDVSFSPQAAGVRTGSLVVTDDSNAAPGTHDTVGLTGVAYQGIATVSPAVLSPSANLGGSSEAQVVTVMNKGDSTLTIRSIAINGAAAGEYVQSNNCPRTIAAGGSCTITVRFTPQGYGLRPATLILSNDGVGGAKSVTLTGTGTAPNILLSSPFLNFGGAAVGSSSDPQSVVLLNSGNGALAIGRIVLAGADFARTTNCGNSLLAGATCSITVIFTPQATGARSGVVTITDTVGTQRFTLSGVGI
jgi:hypothetical protein